MSFKESKFYKEEIVDKRFEMVMLLGCDEYLEFQQENINERSQPDCLWQNIQYFLLQPIIAKPKVFQSLLADYNLARASQGKIVKYSDQPLDLHDEIFYWNIRQKDAIVQFYKLRRESEDSTSLIVDETDLNLSLNENKMLSWIGQINSDYETYGIYIRCYFKMDSCLIVQVKTYTFLYRYTKQFVSKQVLLQSISSALTHTILADLINFHPQKQLHQVIIDESLNLYQQIAFLYHLNKQYALTINFTQQQFSLSKVVFLRANQSLLKATLIYIMSKCAIQKQMVQQQQVLQVIEGHSDSFDLTLKRLYKIVVNRFELKLCAKICQ